jgi:hypothetical protein
LRAWCAALTGAGRAPPRRLAAPRRAEVEPGDLPMWLMVKDYLVQVGLGCREVWLMV